MFQCTHCPGVITGFGNYLQHAAFSHSETLERTDVHGAETGPTADFDSNPYEYPSLATLQRHQVDGAAAAATFWEQAVPRRCSPVPLQNTDRELTPWHAPDRFPGCNPM